jgi:hypothetical protein
MDAGEVMGRFNLSSEDWDSTPPAVQAALAASAPEQRRLPQYGVAIDQWGGRYYFGRHARKDLLEQLHATKASKMYQDKKNGPPVQVGYVIRGHWLTLFERVELPV